ncbi:phosphoenolpyruvate synthase [Thioalkalivibrio sp.]|uniref:phosphoenolpyruvate synthase n=1 Tax=Thioalkalivibrio sp. TaxID=2093813 RepID=UPI0039769185
MNDKPLIRRLASLDQKDSDDVGGKNASLGEMIATLEAQGIRVPGGFATTATAYWRFIDDNELRDPIAEAMGELKSDQSNLKRVGAKVRQMIEQAHWPEDIAHAIVEAYDAMRRETGRKELDVAVRSSATAEDLPTASFAGQLETFLNIRGHDALLEACRKCYASLFTNRAIAYRERQGFDHLQIALSVGVQRMVRSDKAGSGVMFSLDTETGYPDVVLINAAWGLGETVVQGSVDPDEYHVFKPLLSRAKPEGPLLPIIEKRRGGKETKMVYGRKKGDDAPARTVDTSKRERAAFVLANEEILTLGRWAAMIEAHYGKPMDIEWAKDGQSGDLFIVQARPETVHSQKANEPFRSWRLLSRGKKLAEGVAIGDAVATGIIRVLKTPEESDKLGEGDVLVTGMTDPDWVPVMKKAAAIVTDHGGRTSHAAIVSRELGLTAVVGAGDASTSLEDGQQVTVSCAEGQRGFVYEGESEVEVSETDPDEIEDTRTDIMINLANPGAAYRWWRLPAKGIGLARIEFIIGNDIKAHPLALMHPDRVEDKAAQKAIAELTRGYEDGAAFFVDRMARGIARLAAAQWPNPAIVRLSDFKTNEYAGLIGGRGFEPEEANPMLGWRGASRYVDGPYAEAFALECAAVRRAREEIGLENIRVMIPFCRTIDEADRVLATMAEHGLVRGKAGLEIYMMVEIPSNVILARDFGARVDGFSIGTNDLTQLVLGVDRDNDLLASLFDARDPAVKAAITDLLEKAREVGVKTGLCGQAPSDHPEFAAFLVEQGIDSISVSPDSFIAVKRIVARAERAAAG